MPSKKRLEELATKFLWGLIQDDRESAIEYCIEECDMTAQEFRYFGIELTDEEFEEYMPDLFWNEG